MQNFKTMSIYHIHILSSIESQDRPFILWLKLSLTLGPLKNVSFVPVQIQIVVLLLFSIIVLKIVKAEKCVSLMWIYTSLIDT